MTASVSDIMERMEALAPFRLAEEWDNAGLQVGQGDWPVQKIWIALDPLPDVVAAACSADADLLITHHPLILKPLRSIDFSTPAGSIIRMAHEHRLAIFAAHTNLDSAAGGVNDILASEIGLINLKPLVPGQKSEIFKFAVYVPSEYERKVMNALFETQAGNIGKYSCCTFRHRGTGTFKPDDSAKPFSGRNGEISHTDEIRIEAVVPKNELAHVVDHVRKVHPYEIMAYDLYPMVSSCNDEEKKEGLGRVGELGEPTDLASFAGNIKKRLGLGAVKIAGNADLPVRRAAICTGSGSGLIKAFFSSSAQVYVSGDMRYHDARDVQAAGRGLIDIGHFASEHLFVRALGEQLREMLPQTGITDVKVEPCLIEKDPFIIL